MNHKETIAHLQLTIQQRPDNAEVYKGLGNALQALGKLNEAKRAYSISLQIDPEFAAAYGNLGNICYLQGELDRAVEWYERAIAIGSQKDDCRGNAPVLAPDQSGQGNAPVLAPDQSGQGNAPVLAPDQSGHGIAVSLPGLYANLGNVRQEQGLLEEAVACWQETLRLDRNFGAGQLHWKLANLLLNLGRYDEAIACYEKQILLGDRQNDPDRLAKLYSNLGTARLYDGQVEASIAAFNRALEIQPDLVELHCNLGLATGRLAAKSDDPLLASDLFNQAANYFLNSVKVNPNIVEAHRGLFELIRTFQPSNWDLSSVRQAADRYYGLCRENPPAEPAKIVALTARAIAYLKSGNASIAQKSLQEIEQQLSQENGNQWNQELIDLLYSTILFCLNRLRDDLANNSRISQLIGSQFSQYLVNKYAQRRDTAMPCPSSHRKGNQQGKHHVGAKHSDEQFSLKTNQSFDRMLRPDSSHTLKIGFISGHFNRHSVGWCTADIIAELSAINPNIYLYQTQEFESDDKTELFKQKSEKFYQPSRFNLANDLIKMIEEIQQDELDFLIDLDSLTITSHAEILHCNPAPVCISWLGFDAPFISEKNYFLSDWHSHPSGVEQYYREQLLRMPDSFVAVGGFECLPVDAAVQRQAMGIDLDEVVYLCVAPATKLNHELALAQIQILKQVSNSVLLYKGVGDPQVIQSVYQAACEAQGVSFHRVKFLPRNPSEEEHRTIYKIADVLLDSYPYNGGTHNLEALWFQLPIVTRFGEQFLARMGYSFLKTLGISEGLASNWEEYVAWGIKFGQDASLRNKIQNQLQMAKTPEHLSPLWNPQKFAQDMYQVLDELGK